MSALTKAVEDLKTVIAAPSLPRSSLSEELARFGDRAVVMKKHADEWTAQKIELDRQSEEQWAKIEEVRLAFANLPPDVATFSIIMDLILLSERSIGAIEGELETRKQMIEELLPLVPGHHPEEWARRALSHVLRPIEYRLSDQTAQLYALMSIKAGLLPATARIGGIRPEDRLEALLDRWPHDEGAEEIRTGSAVGNEFA